MEGAFRIFDKDSSGTVSLEVNFICLQTELPPGVEFRATSVAKNEWKHRCNPTNANTNVKYRFKYKYSWSILASATL